MSQKQRICRACLATDVFLFNIHNQGLASTYANLVGVSIPSTDKLPPYLCELCTRLFYKYLTYRGRCRDSLRILQNLSSKHKLTSDNVKSINKKDIFNLSSSGIEVVSMEPRKPQLTFNHIITVDMPGDVKYIDINNKNYCATYTHKLKQTTDEFRQTAVIETERDPIPIAYIDLDLEPDTETYKTETELTHSHSHVVKNKCSPFEDVTFKTNHDVLSNEQRINEIDAVKQSGNLNAKERFIDVAVGTADLMDDALSKVGSVVGDNAAMKSDDHIIWIEEPKVSEVTTESQELVVTEAMLQEAAAAVASRNKRKAIERKKQLSAEEKMRTKRMQDVMIQNTITYFDSFPGVRPTWSFARKRMKFIEDFAKNHNMDVKYLTYEEQVEEQESLKSQYSHLAFQCALCYKGYQKRDAFEAHMMVHDESAGDHACRVCRVRARSPRRLRAHVRARHSARFRCRQCGKVTNNFNAARDHFARHSSPTYICDQCGKGFKNRANLSDHERLYHSIREPMDCPICDQSFRGAAGVAVHMNQKHRQAVQCNSCSVHFDNKDALIRHFANTTDGSCLPGIKPCKQCGEGFDVEQQLAEHLKRHRYDLNTCIKCKASFATARRLYSHWRLQHAGLPPPTRKKRNTDTIKRKRETIKEDISSRFVCDVCSKGFKYKTTLYEHMRLHTGERPFKCSYCSKDFRVKLSLTAHLTTHTDERRYKCTICSKKFRQSGHCNAHILTHTNEQPFACSECPKRYTGATSLKDHIDKVHRGLPGRQRNKK